MMSASRGTPRFPSPILPSPLLRWGGCCWTPAPR